MAVLALVILQWLNLSHGPHQHEDPAASTECILCTAATGLLDGVPVLIRLSTTPLSAIITAANVITGQPIATCYPVQARAPPLS